MDLRIIFPSLSCQVERKGREIMRIIYAIFAGLLLTQPIDLQARGDAKSKGGKELGSGSASYYSNEFAGRRTASGETFNPKALTAAHRTAAFGTRIRVTHLGNGKQVTVRINDRGPFTRGRIIDLSYAAAKQIGMHHSGTAKVKLTLVSG
jgi:rare lipoprotein A